MHAASSLSAILLLCVTLGAEASAGDKYAGYQAFVISPGTNAQWDAVMSLHKIPGIDFWAYPKPYSPAVAMVPPKLLTTVHKLLINRHVPYNVTISDVARSLKRSNEQLHNRPANYRRTMGKNPIMHSYLRYKQMFRYIEGLMKTNRGIMKTKRVGTTFEGRNIYVVKLSTDFSAKKPVVFIEAGMHAREWAAPAMALYMITKAVENKTLLSEHDWHIIPVSNPDGYEFSHTKDRLWRKNRVNLGDGCFGVDPNRNFDVDFGRVGGSMDHCSEIYNGPYAFSEAESRAVQLAVKNVSKRVKSFISIHSYGPLIIYPYGFTLDEQPPTYNAMDNCAKAAKAEMDSYKANSFTVGNTAKLLYESSGGSDDWASVAMNVPYAFTVELPGGGEHGFDLPPDELDGVLRLSFRGLLQLANCDKLTE